MLRAVLDADELTGQVLTPRMSGLVSVYHLAAIGPEVLAETTLARDGSFRITAPDLEKWSWRGGRLVIRVRDRQSRQAEGFASVASFAEITRRGGIVTRRLLALITGSETPEDVAAILSWFHEDPYRLALDPGGIRGGGAEVNNDDSDRLVPVAVLVGTDAEAFAAKPHEGAAHRSWSRFIDQILLAFREPRGPFGGTDAGSPAEDEEDDASHDRRHRKEKDPAIAQAFSSFERLFGVLTKGAGAARNALIAFDLTGYICDRLRPDAPQARNWLEKIVKVLLNADLSPERRDDVAAAILTVLGTAPAPGPCRWARASLLSLHADLAGPAPPIESVRGYQTVLLQQESFAELWERVRAVRTYAEQVRSYLQALENGHPVLEAALTSPDDRRRLLIANGAAETCPIHHIKLPTAEIHKLRSTGIATAKNCCRKIVIWQGA